MAEALSELERRFLLRDAGGQVIETPRQMLWRVARHVAMAETRFEGGGADEAYAVAGEFFELMARRAFLPDEPTLRNAGQPNGVLASAFVLPVEDSLEGIFDTIKAAALVRKAGGGTGFSFSRLRPNHNKGMGV